jgi:hypothetical protein
MDKRATMALVQACEEEIASQQVQFQERREFPPPEDPATRHPADLLLSGSVSQLVSFMQAIAEQFSTSVQLASQELMIRVESSPPFNPSADPSSAGSSWSRIQAARALFEERVLEATRQMDVHRQWLSDEFRNLDGHWYGKMLTKVALSQAGTVSESAASEKMLNDQSVDLALVMRALAGQSQRKAYLKGLKLQIQDIAD